MQLEERMQAFLTRRAQNKALRSPKALPELIDFSSNDYLSLAQSSIIKEKVHSKAQQLALGSTGSRLLTGHYNLLEELEIFLAQFHQGEAALVFNSGYNANLSLLSCLPRRSDLILYDELIHASVHDGLKLSQAQSLPFEHNNVQQLQDLIEKHPSKTIFVIVESIYSMDGDAAPLQQMSQLCKDKDCYLIVDEAHSTGLFGNNGAGLCVELGIEQDVFARVHTFGKAIGAHGAAVVGSNILKSYLVNYARPLIYTTALAPHSILSVLEIYKHLAQNGNQYIATLKERIDCFKQHMAHLPPSQYIQSDSPIQTIIVPGNEQVVQLSQHLAQQGMDVRPIRRPTVPTGKERIRICLHRHNSLEEIQELALLILRFLFPLT